MRRQISLSLTFTRSARLLTTLVNQCQTFHVNLKQFHATPPTITNLPEGNSSIYLCQDVDYSGRAFSIWYLNFVLRHIEGIFCLLGWQAGRHRLLQKDSIACIEQLTNHKTERRHVPDDDNTSHHLSWNVSHRTVLYLTMGIL